ncbi:glycosyltransferase family 4 protein [Lysinibacillus sp. HST-98]|uniref:glycosyltransferase family 4 protein n=1 Tax=Lysinibacillus TaxID=400634 RepID=UPI0001DA59F8|nr:glycosyltransferase family 4 protein [Lysinibacillus capsici]EFI68844.1 second mannosyl transferase [Lysinibacillus fusiformis ZC1]MBL3731622.1 glycosyltransferase family 4 protein [Lysinibacillus sp. HST-98]MBU5250359.1 glycosyltransferase family 4 protein [Lysinibacillus capsici]MED4699519.1 glycosyltransferase family 4 protein [Lysinibacillus capsici]
MAILKIVQLITRMDKVGGAQKHVEALAIHLKQDGHDITVVTGSYQPSLWHLQEHEIPVISISALQRAIHLAKDFQAFWQLRAVFKHLQPDVIATHSSKAGVIGRVVGRLLQIPTIFTAHSWSFTEGVPYKKKLFYQRMERSIQPFTTKIITVSEYDRELALLKKVAPAHKLLTIHNGIDPIERNETTEKICMEQPVIVMVARFEVPKRQDVLLKTLAELTDIPWHLQLIGDGSLRPALEHLVEQNGLSNRVTFLGNQLDVHSYLEKCHLFVLLSDWEGLPISIIEAMRVGLPIIATNVGGVKELIIDHDNGFLVERENNELLKKRLHQLLMDAPLRGEMGAASEQRYLQYFTFTPMYQKTLMVYQQAISELVKKGD